MVILIPLPQTKVCKILLSSLFGTDGIILILLLPVCEKQSWLIYFLNPFKSKMVLYFILMRCAKIDRNWCYGLTEKKPPRYFLHVILNYFYSFYLIRLIITMIF